MTERKLTLHNFPEHTLVSKHGGEVVAKERGELASALSRFAHYLGNDHIVKLHVIDYEAVRDDFLIEKDDKVFVNKKYRV